MSTLGDRMQVSTVELVSPGDDEAPSAVSFPELQADPEDEDAMAEELAANYSEAELAAMQAALCEPDEEEPIAKGDYQAAFAKHAKAVLPASVFDSLHRRARAAAGGLAPKPGRQVVTAISFDKARHTEASAKRWLKRNGYDPRHLEPHPLGWHTRVHATLPTAEEAQKPVGPGVTATFGRVKTGSYSQTQEPENKPASRSLAAIAKALHRLVAGDKEPAAAKVASPIRKAEVDPRYLDAFALLVGTDYHLGADYELSDAQQVAVAKLMRDPGAFLAQAREYSFGPVDCEGLDIHLGCGANRWPGHLGVDLVAYDSCTLVQDLSLGIPLPDASCKSVLTHKAFPELADDPGLLTAEVARVLMPGGRLFLLDGLIEKADLAGLVCLGPGEVGLEYVRFVDPHQVAVSEVVDKALSPSTAHPIVQAHQHKQIVYCTVLEPHSMDAHHDVMTPEDIEFSAHRYLTKSRVIGTGHQKPIAATPVESFIAPMDLHYDQGTFGPQVVKKGSWVIGVHIKDPAEWQKVLDGEYTGVSVGGYGLRQDLPGTQGV